MSWVKQAELANGLTAIWGDIGFFSTGIGFKISNRADLDRLIELAPALADDLKRLWFSLEKAEFDYCLRTYETNTALQEAHRLMVGNPLVTEEVYQEWCTNIATRTSSAPRQVKSKSQPKFIYLMRCGKLYKIGMSNDVDRRREQIQKDLRKPLEIMAFYPTNDPRSDESDWHTRFKEKRKQGEWFALDEEDIAVFRERAGNTHDDHDSI